MVAGAQAVLPVSHEEGQVTASTEVPGTAEPRWRAFIRQYADLIQLVRYLPPVWGWAMLAWMRRRECV
jgi:hypothetical protein